MSEQPEQQPTTREIFAYPELKAFLKTLPETAEFGMPRELIEKGQFFIAHVKNPEQQTVIRIMYHGLSEEGHKDQETLLQVKELLETEIKLVEEKRAYISSKLYGDSRFHMVDKKYDGSIQVEQTNVDEKWGSRVQLQKDEIPALLKLLLTWYLADQAEQIADQADEPLGDLDDHPF